MGTDSYADYIRHWGQIDDRIKVNPEMAPFEPLRAQLEIERAGLIDATNRQAALKFETQDTTREIDGHVARGRDLATRLRDAIRAQYGREDEKLTSSASTSAGRRHGRLLPRQGRKTGFRLKRAPPLGRRPLPRPMAQPRK